MRGGVFLGVLFVSVSAWAEDISVDTTTIGRINPDNSQATTRTQPDGWQGIGASDCTGNTSFTFNVAIGSWSSLTPTTYNLQVWAGSNPTDCSSSTTGCWPVTPAISPTASLLTVTVAVQDMLSGIGLSAPPQTYTRAPASACASAQTFLSTTSTSITNDAGSSVTVTGETQVLLFFMLVSVSGISGGIGASAPALPVDVKLLNPDAPTSVGVAPGSMELVVSWTASTDPTVAGYNVSTQLAAVDGGCSDAASDAMATITAVTAGTSTTIPNLGNGNAYDISVAAYDSFGNASPSSGTSCGQPEPITDFWGTYNKDNGQGGGACALGAPGVSAASLGSLGLFAVLGLVRRRGIGRKG